MIIVMVSIKDTSTPVRRATVRTTMKHNKGSHESIIYADQPTHTPSPPLPMPPAHPHHPFLPPYLPPDLLTPQKHPIKRLNSYTPRRHGLNVRHQLQLKPLHHRHQQTLQLILGKALSNTTPWPMNERHDAVRVFGSRAVLPA